MSTEDSPIKPVSYARRERLLENDLIESWSQRPLIVYKHVLPYRFINSRLEPWGNLRLRWHRGSTFRVDGLSYNTIRMGNPESCLGSTLKYESFMYKNIFNAEKVLGRQDRKWLVYIRAA